MINNVSFKGLPSSTRYVSDKLIVGAQQGLLGLRKLKKEENVSLIVDLRRKNSFLSVLLEKFYCFILGIKHKYLPLSLSGSNSSLKKACEETIDSIGKNEKGKTFIHCRHGKHRSVLVSAAVEINDSRIQDAQSLEKFLQHHTFYDVRKTKRFLLFSVKASAEYVQKKLDNLINQKQRFTEMVFGGKK